MSMNPIGEHVFLFTDMEGSTRLWERFPIAMRAALARHDAILREASERRQGHVFRTIGDAFCVAFPDANAAVEAAVEAQRNLAGEDWKTVGTIKVRIGIHGGEAEYREGDYYGSALNRVARIRDTASGGQVIVSESVKFAYEETTGGAGDIRFLDRGSHRLKDIPEPVRLFQVCAEGLPERFPPLKTLSTHPHNLPAPAGAFIGRDAELQEICSLLTGEGIRLVTLTGFGGMGKTRLAQEVGRRVLERFPDGVWFVDLAGLETHEQVLPAIVRTLGLREEAANSLLEQLIAFLSEKRLLLIPDNFEQVLDAAPEIAELLRRCASLAILATSRSPLDLRAEYTYELPPLSPEEGQELFRTRAQQANRRFAADVADAVLRAEVAAVCDDLDGVPLAIELAAAQVRRLSVAEIRIALAERLRLLTSQMRDMPVRHLSLRNTIDWTYDRLTIGEKADFRCITVFADGFSAEAATVLFPPPDPVDPMNPVDPAETERRLSLLADHSLIRIDLAGETSGAGARYRVLESLRQYGHEKLREAGEWETVRTRHRDWALVFAEAATGEPEALERAETLDRLEREHGNFRLALDWCLREATEAVPGLRLAVALQPLWEIRGYFREGRHYPERLLEASGDGASPTLRAAAFRMTGQFAWFRSEFADAERCFERSLSLADVVGDRVAAATALRRLGDVSYAQGDYARAEARQRECLAVYEALDDRAGISDTLTNLGNIAFSQGRPDDALPYYRRSLEAATELGDLRRQGNALNNLGMLARERKELPLARSLFERNLTVRRQLNDRHGEALARHNLAGTLLSLGEIERASEEARLAIIAFYELEDRRLIAFGLDLLASLLLQTARFEEAVRFTGAAASLRERIGIAPPPHVEESQDACQRAARAEMGAAAVTAAAAHGATMTPEELLARIEALCGRPV
ncbi:MAG: tetratricopeptide repeat protein [Capsulimonadales bacterium]|nr:tetratricopeptide repeat protein [Capsulimonadales bacterium]